MLVSSSQLAFWKAFSWNLTDLGSIWELMWGLFWRHLLEFSFHFLRSDFRCVFGATVVLWGRYGSGRQRPSKGKGSLFRTRYWRLWRRFQMPSSMLHGMARRIQLPSAFPPPCPPGIPGPCLNLFWGLGEPLLVTLSAPPGPLGAPVDLLLDPWGPLFGC